MPTIETIFLIVSSYFSESKVITTFRFIVYDELQAALVVRHRMFEDLDGMNNHQCLQGDWFSKIHHEYSARGDESLKSYLNCIYLQNAATIRDDQSDIDKYANAILSMKSIKKECVEAKECDPSTGIIILHVASKLSKLIL